LQTTQLKDWQIDRDRGRQADRETDRQTDTKRQTRSAQKQSLLIGMLF
jgi:hypothetical protein